VRHYAADPKSAIHIRGFTHVAVRGLESLFNALHHLSHDRCPIGCGHVLGLLIVVDDPVFNKHRGVRVVDGYPIFLIGAIVALCMASNNTALMNRAASLLLTAFAGILTAVWAAATSPQVQHTIKASVSMICRGIVPVLRGIARFLGRQYPTARNIVRRGIIGGWRYFRSQFNRNRSSMIRSTRNQLSPLEWVAVTISVVVLLIQPVVGVALLLITLVVFFQNADQLSLSSFSVDSAGVGSVVGVGTTLLINLFVLFSAIPATINYIRTQI